VKKLLKSEDPNDVSQKGDFQQTPLHRACTLSNIEIVKLLLRRKADVNAQDRNGWTPLHCAAKECQLAICQLLLTIKDIDVNVMNNDGNSFLHYMVRSIPAGADQLLCRDIFQLYTENRGNLNTQSRLGEAALHQACQRGNLTATRFLVENNASVDVSNRIGETPLLCAVRADSHEIVRCLLDHEADINAKFQNGSLLDQSPSQEMTDLLLTFLRRNERKKSGSTATLESKSSSLKQRDLSELKLQLSIVRLTHLIPTGTQDNVSPHCEIVFGSQRKQTGVQNATTNPVFNQTFFFEIEDAPIHIHVLGDNGPRDLLGSISFSLYEMSIDCSGEGIPTQVWLNLRRKIPTTAATLRPLLSKIQVELCFVLKDKDKPLDIRAVKQEATREAPSKCQKNWARGSCYIHDCECKSYTPESPDGGTCQGCGHWPAQHENLGCDEAFEPPVDGVSHKKHNSNTDIVSEINSLKLAFASTKKKSSSPASWEVSPSTLQFAKRLGEGAFAGVFSAFHRNKEVAVKVYRKTPHAKAMIEHKAHFDAIQAIKHPHVVTFHGACLHPVLAEVKELCGRGSLYDILNNPKENVSWEFVIM